MQETTQAILRAIMLGDPTLTESDRRALCSFIEAKRFNVVVAEGCLMLNATKAAEFLGVSTDTFKRIRDRAEERGVKELCGVELTPSNFMFSRIALIRLSQGEFDLDWTPVVSKARVVDFKAEVREGKAVV